MCGWVFILITVVTSWSVRAHDFVLEREYVRMKDGVRIATTLLKPQRQFPGEKFPVLIEMQPYRKDDLFLARDYALHSYFARNGYVVIKADVRGTGSSTGRLPDREYSERELSDAVALVEHYAAEPWSTGAVGMFGISWSGFNALQTALRAPPALKAVLAAHASDDLFHDDVHFLDGNFHIDEYELGIENDLSLPRSPDYRLDAEYFRDRFNREPWFLRYKREQKDGPFWRKESLLGQYERLKVPAFLIGGLLDGYRDTLAHALDFSAGPVFALLGPWNHAWPNNGDVCPCFEWRDDALRWWDFWLKGVGSPPPLGELASFQRDSANTGRWFSIPWRSRQPKTVRYHFTSPFGLALQPTLDPTEVALTTEPAAGITTGYWWGDETGDLREDAQLKTGFESEPLNAPLSIIGTPVVRIRAASDQPWVHWAVQLEDRAPDGTLTLITGAVLNSSQATSRQYPSSIPQNIFFDFKIPLHFTTWTFQPGHRIRLSISHAQFPMVWSAPHLTRSRVDLRASNLELPLLPPEAVLSHNYEDAPGPIDSYPGLEAELWRWPHTHTVTREPNGISRVVWKADKIFRLDGQDYSFFEETEYSTHSRTPKDAQFNGRAGHRVQIGARRIEVLTDIDVSATETDFKIIFSRTAIENGRTLKQKTWRETVPRKFH